MKKIPNLLSKLKIASEKKALSFSMPFYSSLIPILEILYDEGYIQSYQIINNKEFYIYLRYYLGKPVCNVIKNFRRSSKQSYVNCKNLYKFSRNSGVLILSTTQGILVHEECLTRRLGGQVLCYIR